MEVWKEIQGTAGQYFISSLGKVESRIRGRFPKRLTTRIDRAGYLTVRLVKMGKVQTFYIHRLIAQAFIHNDAMKPEVNHINGIKTDNRIENLEWVTRAENMQHAYRCGLIDLKAKPVFDDLFQVRYASVKEAALAWGINEGTCRNYLNGNLTNKTALRYGEPIVVHIPIKLFGYESLLYTRKVIRYI